MRIMRQYGDFLAFWGGGEKICFVEPMSFTKQISNRAFGVFISIYPHKPHNSCFHKWVVWTNWPREVKNMRIMRQYEDRVFKGFYLFRIDRGWRPRPINEDTLEKYEAYLHVYARSRA